MESSDSSRAPGTMKPEMGIEGWQRWPEENLISHVLNQHCQHLADYITSICIIQNKISEVCLEVHTEWRQKKSTRSAENTPHK